MIVALATPRVAAALDDGLDKIERHLADASAQGAEIICFPEAYLPGLRGQDFDVFPFDQARQEQALEAVTELARAHAIAVVLGMERLTPAGPPVCPVVFAPPRRDQG